MGRRGPAKKPTALRILHGDQARYINADEPQPSDGPVDGPDGMSADVRAVWDFVLAELTHMNLARRPDTHQLRAYCEAVVAHAHAARMLEVGGMLLTGADKKVRPNPAMDMMTKSARTMLIYAREFGLTPASRVQFHVEQLAQDNAERLLS
jgi:P27 family predicted phage terminase small subunit